MFASRASSSRDSGSSMLFSISEITSNSDLFAEPRRATSGMRCCALVSRTCSTMNCSAICVTRAVPTRAAIRFSIMSSGATPPVHVMRSRSITNSSFRKRVSGNSSFSADMFSQWIAHA